VVEAPHIIDTFRSIFPAEGGRVVFGPVVQIAWGTPALVEAELGIVVSLPDPITVAVLGSIKSVLPTAELDLVALRLDLAGVIDTAAGTLSIDASLHDSHVVGFALSGDLALRADFGGRPSFLMALGGFHPRFEAPAGFPSLRRLRLAISPSPLLEVSFECYMALTSNTAQFGARFDLSAEIEGFGIEGGVSFDALIQFTPFVLSTQLGFHISIKAVGIDLAAVWLDVSLTGPNAWELDGVTRFKLLGIETELPIHETIGRGRAEPAPPPVDPRLALIAALDQPAAWAVIGTPTSSGVSLASTLASQDTVLIASPDSAITVTQRVAPLGVTLEHVGDAPIGPHHTFQLETTGAGIEPTGETRDWFAPADFFEMRPTEALQAPSFEELSAGLEFAGESSTAGTPRTGLLEYEQILRDPELAEDSIELPTQRLVDRTPETLTPLRSTAGAGITVVVDDAPALAEARWTTTDALTGAEIGRYRSWSEARAADGSDPVLTPEWEMAL
jgi:hypothetical protein